MIKKILKENYLYLIIITILVIVLPCIFRSSLHDNIISFDYQVIDFVRKLVYNNLTKIFRIITFFGDLYIPIIIIVCILVFVKNKWYFAIISSSYLFAGAIAFITKNLAARQRPLEALITIPNSYSFPSGHTLTSVVFYTVLTYLLINRFKIKNKKICYICSSILIILIAFSRIYLGVHFFSDVIGGIVIGIPCLLMILNIIKLNFIKKLNKK